MGKTIPAQIPEEIYEILEEEAQCTGVPIETIASEWLASFPQLPPPPTGAAAEKAWQRLARHFGTFNSGDPRSADNDRIDADLESEYENDHANER